MQRKAKQEGRADNDDKQIENTGFQLSSWTGDNALETSVFNLNPGAGLNKPHANIAEAIYSMVTAQIALFSNPEQTG